MEEKLDINIFMFLLGLLRFRLYSMSIPNITRYINLYLGKVSKKLVGWILRTLLIDNINIVIDEFKRVTLL